MSTKIKKMHGSSNHNQSHGQNQDKNNIQISRFSMQIPFSHKVWHTSSKQFFYVIDEDLEHLIFRFEMAVGELPEGGRLVTPWWTDY